VNSDKVKAQYKDAFDRDAAKTERQCPKQMTPYRKLIQLLAVTSARQQIFKKG